MPQMSAMLAAAKEGTLTLPGSNFGFDRLLHGEQYTEIKRPLPAKDLSANGHGYGRELFGLFRRNAGLAENGASALFGND